MRFQHLILCLAFLLAPLGASAGRTVLVKADTLTLREKPATSGKAVDKLITSQPVELLKEENSWSQVKTTRGQTGWVLSRYLDNNAFVYIDNEKLNGRLGPGTQYDIIIEYGQPNMPLRVIDATPDGWLLVMDYDGDRSWVFGKLVKTTGRYVITKVDNSNVRKGVGLGEDRVFTARKGVIFEVLEEKDGWLKVRYEDGDEGWMSAKLVFGWLEVDPPASESAKSDSDTDKSASASSKSKSASKRSKSKSR